ncbi:hypothetical protein NL676_014569 [Syzygium grande]|nr:hypothetical protein NL676_014569 [Syzygium grande]
MKKLRVQKVKVEEILEKRNEMLKQKDKEPKAKESELEKFRCEFKMLGKFKESKPTMTLPIGHTRRDKEQLKEKKKDFPKKKRPSPPYIPRCSDSWKRVGKKPNEKNDQIVDVKVLRMELNQLKHEMKIMNERLDDMSMKTETRKNMHC